MGTGPSLCDTVNECDVFDRRSINVESFMVASQLCHHPSFEY